MVMLRKILDLLRIEPSRFMRLFQDKAERPGDGWAWARTDSPFTQRVAVIGAGCLHQPQCPTSAPLQAWGMLEGPLSPAPWNVTAPVHIIPSQSSPLHMLLSRSIK